MTTDDLESMPVYRLWEQPDGPAILQLRGNDAVCRIEIVIGDDIVPLMEAERVVPGLASAVLDRIARDLFTGRLTLKENAE